MTNLGLVQTMVKTDESKIERDKKKRSWLAELLLGIITLVVVDFYLFPTTFLFFPFANTKLCLAIIGVAILSFFGAATMKGRAKKWFIVLIPIGCAVSLISFVSCTYNGTSDYTYATYIFSMATWFFGAYFVYSWLRYFYGDATVIRICNFIIIVCFLQCLIALSVKFNITVQHFVDSIIDTRWMRGVKRMYGIGAELDTAGIKFSIALVMISYILMNSVGKLSNLKLSLYIVAFLFILIVGNMMARTTTMGGVVALFYMIYKFKPLNSQKAKDQAKLYSWFGLITLIIVFVVSVFYASNGDFREQIRFAFEGFFSYFERGEFMTASTNTLKSMYVWPESLKTWIIGDGYIVNPRYDPYYIGPVTEGYYMNTDVGYLRFIFYFGLIGLIIFSSLFFVVANLCIKKHPKYMGLILLMLLINFMVWFKVSTDCFFIFALLLLSDEEITKADELGNEDHNLSLQKQ